MNTTQSRKAMYDILDLIDGVKTASESYLKMAFKEDGDRAISIFRDHMDGFCYSRFIASAEIIAQSIKDQNERLEELNKRQAKEKGEK